jgi:hypothetical protein
MPRSKAIDMDELDESRMRFDHEEPPQAKLTRSRDEDDDIEPLDLGSSRGDRFGRLTDRDTSGSW